MMARVESSVTVTDWVVAVGTSLTGVTVMDTVAGAEVRLPSAAVKVRLSGPL